MTKLKELSELSLLSLYGIHKQKEKSRLQGGEYFKKKQEKHVGFGVDSLGLSSRPVTHPLIGFTRDILSSCNFHSAKWI